MTYMEKYMKMQNFYNYGKEGDLVTFQVTEKMDGANFRFMFLDSMNITFGSRNIEGIEPTAMGSSEADGGMKSFGRYMEYVKNMTRGHTYPASWNKRYTFFMEALMPHKIKYEVDENFLAIGFAVFDNIERIYVKDWFNMFNTIGLATVPLLGIDQTNPYEWEEFIEKDEAKSRYDGVSRIEGVVLADYDNQVFYKIKTAAFTEVQREKTKVPKNNIKAFVDKYATIYRIEKLLDLMELEGTFNKKNAFPSVAATVMHDIIMEAEPRDIKKAFGGLIMPLLADKLRGDKRLLGRIINMNKKEEKE